MQNEITIENAKNIGETIILSNLESAKIIGRNWIGNRLESYIVRFKGCDMPINPYTNEPMLAH